VPELDFTEDSENAQEIQKLREEAAALKNIRQSMGSADFAKLIFQKVFTDDIERLRSMEDMWKSRAQPNALSFDELSKISEGKSATEIVENDQVVWSLAENFSVFVDSLRRLSKRIEELKANLSDGEQPILSFDKGDDDTLDFVSASANLRSHIFGIDMQSEFDIKRMAGNIIPAIATTNAIIAGLAVLESFKVLRGKEHYKEAVPVYNTIASTEWRLASDANPPRPNRQCPVCSVTWSEMKVDPERGKLSDLVAKLKDDVGYTDEFNLTTGDSRIVYDPELDDNLSKSFKELDIVSGTFLTVTDERDEEPRVNLVLSVKETAEMEGHVHLPERLEIPTRWPELKPVARKEVEGSVTNKMKRKADNVELPDENPKKKGKAAANGDDEVITLADAEDGAILIE